MNVMRLMASLLLGWMLAGCGQKGPLLHPDTPKHKKVLPAPKAPAAAPSTPAPAESPAPASAATIANP